MRKSIVFALAISLAVSLPALADEDYDEGLSAYKVKKYSEAAAAFARYVEKVPEAFQGHQMLGVALLKSGQAAKAATHLGRANELKPGQPSIQLAQGQALLAAGKARDACGVLGRIEESSLPAANRTSLYQLRSRANCGGGSGLSDLKKIAQAKNTGNSWAAYGVAAYNDNKMTEAVAALDKAVSLSPNDAKIRKSHVSALVRTARTAKGASKDATYNKALASARKYSEVDGSYSAKLTYGEVLLGAKKYNEAVSALQAASSKSPGEWLPNFYLGQAFTSLGDFASAEGPLQRALSQTSKAADQKMINRQLGFTYEKQKKYAESISFYQKAGDAGGVARVQENQTISEDNADADKFNKEREALLAEQARLRKALEEVPTGGPPPFR